MRLSACCVLAGALLVIGCRGGGGGGDDDPVDARVDGDVDPDDVTVYQIQGGTLEGQTVSVRGVIVTAIDAYGDRRGNFWIQEADGGPFSGVLVFGAPVDQVAALRVGDVVDVENAVVVEFALDTDTSGRTTTELVRPDGGQIRVVKVDDGAAPAPAVVDALAIGQLPTAEARDAEWEKWEGVLIRLENVRRLTNLRMIGDDPTFVEFQVTGPLRVDSSLAAITPEAIGPAGTCFASITGIGDYFFNYKLLPRATDEIVTGGTDCPAPEAGEEACDDGVDNDANGFLDCADFGCRDAQVCQENPTIAQIQMGSVPVNTLVSLPGVYVTGLTFDRRHLWVADALQGAPYNGIYVFRGGGAMALPDEIVIGARIDVTGRVAEYNNDQMGDTMTQLTQPTVTFVAAPGDAPTPVTGVPLTTLNDPAMGEPYEGVFVRIGPVRVTEAPVPQNFGVTTFTNGAVTVRADDSAYRPSPSPFTVGTCFARIDGIWNYNVFVNAFMIEPLSASSIVADPDACTGF